MTGQFREATEEVALEVTRFLVDNGDFYARWMSERRDPSELEWLLARFDRGWQIVNLAIPEVLADRPMFVEAMGRLQGRCSDDPVVSGVEMLGVWEIGDDALLSAHVQRYHGSDTNDVGLETTVFVRDREGRLRIRFVHE